MKPLFITGIGTGIGKTIVSAIFVEKLKADYWKPVQSGDLNNSDTDKVRSLITNKTSVFHPEAYRLTQPFSPHKSAKLDGIEIELSQIEIPESNNRLVVEGAGGLMVPLNDKVLIIDLIEKLEADVILVSRNYLGSINHTLLSLEILKQRQVPIKALVFNGTPDADSENFITCYSGIETIIRVPEIVNLSKEEIYKTASTTSFTW